MPLRVMAAIADHPVGPPPWSDRPTRIGGTRFYQQQQLEMSLTLAAVSRQANGTHPRRSAGGRAAAAELGTYVVEKGKPILTLVE